MKIPSLAALLMALALTPGAASADDDATPPSPPAATIAVRDGVVSLTLDPTGIAHAGIVTAGLAATPATAGRASIATVLDPGSLAALAGQAREAQAAARATAARDEEARAEAARARTLYADQHNISGVQLEDALEAQVVAQADLTTAQARLQTLSAQAATDWDQTLAQDVINGGGILPALVARQRVLVRVALAPGTTMADQAAGASVQTATGATIPLTWLGPAPQADPTLQTPAYDFTAPATPGLVPGLTLAATLPTSQAEGGAAVPEQAVVWLQGRPFVYLQTAPTRFERRAIDPEGQTPQGAYEIRNLSPGTKVVVAGAQMLLSEEFRAVATEGGDQD
jgi:hypothetical protein